MSTNDSRIKQWSTTPASNGTAPNIVPYGWPEGMAPSEVNDTARQQMTDHRYQWEDAQWFNFGDTVSKASATTFKIATDVTSRYEVDRRVKLFDTSTKYATIISSSYSAPDTTVGLQFDSETSIGASFTAIALAILTPTNSSIPAKVAGTQPNIIIGGDFTTNPWQRGVTFTSAGGIYTADRFLHSFSSDAVVDILKTADSPTAVQAGVYSTSCLHVDVTTADGTIAAGQYEQIDYIVEGIDIAKLGFGQAGTRYLTLSFWHKHTKTGTYCVSLRNSAANRSYVIEYTQTSTEVWEKAIATIAVDTTGTWLYTIGTIGLYITFSIAVGSTFQTPASVWTAGNYTASSNQVNGLDSNSNNFRLALIKLEPGQIATSYPLEYENEVLSRCQRYYRKSYDAGTYAGASATNGAMSYLTAGTAYGAGTRIHNTPFNPMSKVPTVTVYSTTGTASRIRNVSAGSDLTAVADYVGDRGFSTNVSNTMTANNMYSWQFEASAELV